MFVDWKSQHTKDINSFKFIYRVKAVSVKIPARSFTDMHKIILKLTRKNKGTRITMLQCIVIRTVWYL